MDLLFYEKPMCSRPKIRCFLGRSDFFNETITENDKVYYEPNTHWKTGLLGAWIKINQINNDYRGINLLELEEKDWLGFEKNHDSIDSIDIISPLEITAKLRCSPIESKNRLIDVTTSFVSITPSSSIGDKINS